MDTNLLIYLPTEKRSCPMDRTITTADFTERLADYTAEVRAKAIELANQLLQEDPDLTAAAALERGLERAERWWLDRAG